MTRNRGARCGAVHIVGGDPDRQLSRNRRRSRRAAPARPRPNGRSEQARPRRSRPGRRLDRGRECRPGGHAAVRRRARRPPGAPLPPRRSRRPVTTEHDTAVGIPERQALPEHRRPLQNVRIPLGSGTRPGRSPDTPARRSRDARPRSPAHAKRRHDPQAGPAREERARVHFRRRAGPAGRVRAPQPLEERCRCGNGRPAARSRRPLHRSRARPIHALQPSLRTPPYAGSPRYVRVQMFVPYASPLASMI